MDLKIENDIVGATTTSEKSGDIVTNFMKANHITEMLHRTYTLLKRAGLSSTLGYGGCTASWYHLAKASTNGTPSI